MEISSGGRAGRYCCATTFAFVGLRNKARLRGDWVLSYFLVHENSSYFGIWAGRKFHAKTQRTQRHKGVLNSSLRLCVKSYLRRFKLAVIAAFARGAITT